MPTDVYVTEGLLDALLDLAAGDDPDRVSAALAVTPASDLDGGVDLDPETPVFTDLFVPRQHRSVNAVFGMDVTTPPHQTQGRFVSHPLGRLDVTKEDDLHEVVLVAIPPWDRDAVAAFDRRGRRRSLVVLDAAPPVDDLDDFEN
ncbi:hypothetical protein SAMN06269185_0967 [Natronoarchaeum philippinense]|uniref:Proteasome lid subunit RPN8/RPN11, contains Jab1/MPN metalloenzyme (JAMM) motif n=1 Tax=Natronoarchaeum philippinense TaxID=558529 RepID=A0A285N8W4_NATPI|nr:hypothetical protein [Natronoarchaeum philippinense]SNZ05859.1 hypothetical protein SAMN06269185_0967 [Natronoarchaeum philippinense]